ncbi:MAG: peptidoglycan-binding protein [Rhodospirillales bacterium]|nr:peptidoglycan-binding protein [Rhodospirillales bacterium]
MKSATSPKVAKPTAVEAKAEPVKPPSLETQESPSIKEAQPPKEETPPPAAEIQVQAEPEQPTSSVIGKSPIIEAVQTQPVQAETAPPKSEKPFTDYAALSQIYPVASFAPIEPRAAGSCVFSDNVKAAQALMRQIDPECNLGSKDGQPDGYHGPATAASVREMQQQLGVEPNGIINPEFMRQMQAHIDLQQSLAASGPMTTMGTGKGLVNDVVLEQSITPVNEDGKPILTETAPQIQQAPSMQSSMNMIEPTMRLA